MSTTTIAKKRKSADGTTATSKKVKMSKSADKPQPLKSALKKTKSSGVEEPAANARKTTKKTAKETPAEDPEETTDLTTDQTAALLAGFSSDSEPEEEDEDEGIALSSLPKPPTPQPKKKEDDAETTPEVLYISRLPHGFYESQMRAYFSQFGEILHLRLARNKKTGKSQHHAFVEFASAAVADIVARTMDKYLLFGHILQVRKVPREMVKENMFAGSAKRRKGRMSGNKVEGKSLRRGKTRERWEGRIEKERRRREGKKMEMEELGYEFEMPRVKGTDAVPVKANAVEGEIDEVKAVENGDGQREVEVEEETTMKKRQAHGKTEVKKVVKKRKA